MPESSTVTELLKRVAEGDAEAANALVPSLYADLHRIAHNQRYRWRGDPTLHTTALLHEAWMKVSAHRGTEWASRQHFYAVCTRAMKQILLNHAQARMAQKRGTGAVQVPLDGLPDLSVVDAELVLSVGAAINALRVRSERLAEVVEHRVFGGFSVEEVAEILEVSPRTVKRDWNRARAWLGEALAEESPSWQAFSTS